MINALFAPDWRDGVPYQRLLAEALYDRGVNVTFVRNYRRVLPLARLVRMYQKPGSRNVLHLHWPEAYYPSKGDRWDLFRFARYPLDLALARIGRAFVVTAHNLHAHNRPSEPFAFRNTRASFQQAQITIAHSVPAKTEIEQLFGVPAQRIRVIPHGDLSVAIGAPLPRAEARRALGFGSEKLVLMFGAVEPYKGIEEIVDFWRDHRPEATLIVTGRPNTAAYGAELAARASGVARLQFRPGWLSDEHLQQWLSAVDCVVFNYRSIFTSGAACLARSYGIPILLPSRLKTVALDEPHPTVFRFEDLPRDFERKLGEALDAPPDYESAAAWREATAWPKIAEVTASAYEDAIRAR